VKLRVLLFALPILVPFVLESVHSRTSSGNGNLPAVAFVRIAAIDPSDAPPAMGVKESGSKESDSPSPLLALIANDPQPDIGRHSADTRSADRRYDILLRHSAWYRGLRETRECDPIDASELKQTCRQSFGTLQVMPRDKIREALAAR
jgi:hypothetical protein